MDTHPTPPDLSRRDALKKAVFVAPVILTLPAVASFAKAASGPLKPPKSVEIPLPKDPKVPKEPKEPKAPKEPNG